MENYSEKFMGMLTGLTETIESMSSVSPSDVLQNVSQAQQDFVKGQMEIAGEYFKSINESMTVKGS